MALLSLALFSTTMPLSAATSSAVDAELSTAELSTTDSMTHSLTEAEIAETENASTTQDDGTVQHPVIQDEVFVQGSPPEIPTSNTVAAKLPLSLRETPASVGLVDEQTLLEQDIFTVGEALENIAGLNVQPGSGTFDFYVVRGIDSLTSGLILTDGAPEPETTAYPLYNVERVEVLKGPASFLYGGGPMGSTLNLVRKRPLFGGSYGRFSLSVGSLSTLESMLDVNHANASGSLGFRLNALYQESDNFRDAKESDVLAINPSLTWRANPRTAVHFNVEHTELDYVSDSGIPLVFAPTPNGSFALSIPDVRRENNYQSPFDTSAQEAVRLQVDVETQLSSRLTLRNKTYHRRLDWFTRGAIFNGVFPNPTTGSPLISRTLTQLDDLQEFTGNQFEFLGRFETGVIEHNLLFGLELARRDDTFTFDIGLLPEIDLLNPVETASGAPFFLPGFGFAADTTTEIVAPYVVDQITFKGSGGAEKVQLLLGARYDQIDFEDTVFRVEREDDELSPMLGLVVLPTKTLSLYASYGEGFAPQSTFVVGESREPEESDQIEVGVRGTALGGRLNISAALYRLDRENVAIPDGITGVLQQTGAQRAEGLEIELTAELRSGTRVLFAYAYTDSELTEFRERVQIGPLPTDIAILDRSGNTAAFTPEHLANLWVSHRFGRFTVGGGARYLSEQFTAEDNSFELDSYGLLDAAFAYTMGDWRLHVNLRNLTDEEYFTRASLGNSVIPMPGFTLATGFQYTF